MNTKGFKGWEIVLVFLFIFMFAAIFSPYWLPYFVRGISRTIAKTEVSKLTDTEQILRAIEEMALSIPLTEKEKRLVSIRNDIIDLLKKNKESAQGAAEKLENSKYRAYCYHCEDYHIKITYKEYKDDSISNRVFQTRCEKNKKCGKDHSKWDSDNKHRSRRRSDRRHGRRH